MCACGQQWAGPLTSVGRSQGQLWTCTTVCPDGTQRGSEVTAMTAGTLLREFCGPVQINTAGEGGGGCKGEGVWSGPYWPLLAPPPRQAPAESHR